MNIKPVRIGSRYVGPGHPCFFVSEIGINHNGDIAIAKKLIDIAKKAGSDAVKFQKRTIEHLYTKKVALIVISFFLFCIQEKVALIIISAVFFYIFVYRKKPH